MRKNGKPRRTRFGLQIEDLETKRMLTGDDVASHPTHATDSPFVDGAGFSAGESDGETIEVDLAQDIDGDGVVGFADFLVVAGNFGATDASLTMGDFDGDYRVGFTDFLLLARSFGSSRTDAGRLEAAGPKDGRQSEGPDQAGQGVQQTPLEPPDEARSGPPAMTLPGRSRFPVFRQTGAEFLASVAKTQTLGDSPFTAIRPDATVVYHPVLQAGSAAASPPDSPSLRIDPNSPGSAFAGVGSLEVIHPFLGTFLCSGSVISDRHVLTAAHCFDIESSGDGIADAGLTVTFRLNDGGSPFSQHAVSAIRIHPDFSGVSTEVNDDLAVVELATPVPSDTPRYSLDSVGIALPQRVQLVGYGQSGYGDTGFSVLPNFVDKRSGENVVDLLIEDDEGTGPAEIYLFDFDEPTGADAGRLGTTTLGNRIETTLGGGDSGGPAFVRIDGELAIVGVNTFQLDLGAITPPPGYFGSLAGGVVVASSLSWIEEVVDQRVANQPPSFVIGPDQLVLEDAGAQSVEGWVTEISPGSPREASQTLTFRVTANTNPGLFAVAPRIDAEGTLTYTPASDANGSAAITIELTDDGGTSSDGQDTSPPQTFTITVEPVNDRPSIQIAGDQTVAVNAGPQVVEDFATGFHPGGGADEVGQAIEGFIVANDNPDIFSVQPHVDENGRLLFTPAEGKSGRATLSVQVRDDGGTENGGVDVSERMTFVISVASEAQQIGLVEEHVRQLVVTGNLREGIGKSLSAKLASALASMERGKPETAKRQLDAFSKEIEGLLSGDQLAPAQGERLLESVDAIFPS